ncbi:hypothetical protein [Algoriphagus sp.]|jgi:hypothetical protein|uniref:hypothetical protein n=1 Tax=Algoriphagus sp. TaxID=1872435 RepID=UPI0027216420|nr:hypothetical protein [Algoriphagus sp.]MDO8965713.1 hypothetical protein [Algoriphagus sp.]MDP3202406.1 hypothetical protein [Algoriphagus sp.]
MDYFKGFLTGRTYVTKRVAGVNFRYSYSDKPVFFDPFGMLDEFKQRSSDSSVQRIELKTSFSEPFPGFIYPVAKDSPSVQCTCSKNGQELKTTRFTFKNGIYPVSFYRFELNGNLVGTFRRQYDYGAQFQTIGLHLATIIQSAMDPEKEKWLWETESGAQIFLENFGNSQLWVFQNSELLDI